MIVQYQYQSKKTRLTNFPTSLDESALFPRCYLHLQSNQLQLVQRKIQRFRQSIKRGEKDAPSHEVCVDLSTSLTPLGFEAEYNPAVMVLRNPQQETSEPGEKAPDNPTQGLEPDSGIDRGVWVANDPNPETLVGENNTLVSASSRPHTRSQARDNPLGTAPSILPQRSEISQIAPLANTGTRPKSYTTVAYEHAVETRREYEVDQARQPIVTSTQVTTSCFEYSLNLDPGDPINASPVPVLQPVHGSGSDLIGFTGSPGPRSRHQPTSSDVVATERVAKKGKRKGNVAISDNAYHVGGTAFPIYHDPSVNPSTVTYTMHNQPITYPYRNTRGTSRIPLAPLKPRTDNPPQKQRNSESRDAVSLPRK